MEVTMIPAPWRLASSVSSLPMIVPFSSSRWLMAPVFQERKVAPEILSRCLEDSGTMAGPMIPWHGYGVYMAGTLGVAWSAFFPYLFLLYLTPVFSIFYGFTGISIKHLPETKNNESKEEK